MDIRFLIDEHLRGQLWQALVAHNQRGTNPVDVVRIGDLTDLPLGSSDPEVLVWAEREGRILISGDRRTLLQHLIDHLASGHHSPGLFLIRPSTSIPDLVDFLVAVAYASEPGEWLDVWRYVP